MSMYCLPSVSARPPVPVIFTPHHRTSPVPFIRFGVTFGLLPCISILLYYAIPIICRKLVSKRETQKLPTRVVSTIIAELQGDTRSLKACSLVSRSWSKESHRYLFHTVSLNTKQSADLWFSPDALVLASHVRSIRLSMETVAGTEHALSRFPRVKTLCILGWHGFRRSSPIGWSPLDSTVGHLELVQPEGAPHEVLTFVSFFTSLESLLVTHSHQQLRWEVRASRMLNPGVVSIHFRMLRHLPADGVGPTRPRSGNGISVRLRESGSLFLTPYAETLGAGFDPQDVDGPLNVLLGCSNSRATRSCTRCFTGRSLAYPLARLIRPRSRNTSILRIGVLPEAMIGMTDRLLISLPCISPQSTKVTIERFHGVDTIPVDKILPRFRSLGGVVEIGIQGIRI